MRRPRFTYYFRAIICFIFSFIFIILPIIPSVREKGITFGIGIGLAILSLVVGLINYYIAKEDSDIEKQKDKEIERLEKELYDIKNDKSKDYKMRDFD